MMYYHDAILQPMEPGCFMPLILLFGIIIALILIPAVTNGINMVKEKNMDPITIREKYEIPQEYEIKNGIVQVPPEEFQEILTQIKNSEYDKYYKNPNSFIELAVDIYRRIQVVIMFLSIACLIFWLSILDKSLDDIMGIGTFVGFILGTCITLGMPNSKVVAKALKSMNKKC